MYRFFIYFIYILVINPFLFQIQKSNAQDLQDYLTISELVEELEEKHSYKIFYKNIWFNNKEYHQRLLELSFNDVLEIITSDLNLTPFYLDNYIIIVPSEGTLDYEISREGDFIVVGNPLDLGRFSSATLDGYVYDGATGDPLIGAIVFDETVGIGTSTDVNGRYALTLPVGDNKIRLSYLGYQDYYQNVRLITSGNLDFDLFEKSVHLEGATVTAFRKDANIRSTQMSTIRLDPIMLKEMPGALGERDIIKNFTLLPGIQSVGEFGTGFNVRGANSDQNLIIIEDMPIFNSSHLFGLVSIVNPDMVTSVTLIKGGIPAKYGERASSIVDIRKRGGNPDAIGFKGGIGLLYSRLHLESPLFNRKAFVSLGGRSSYSNWLLRQIPDQDLMNSSASFYDISGVLAFNVNNKNSISIFGYQSNDDFLLSGETKHSYQSRLASIRVNSTLTPFFVSRFTLGFSQYSNNIQQPINVQPQNAFSMSSLINYGTMKWQFDLKPDGKNVYDFGIQAIYYGIEPGSVVPLGENSFVEPLILDQERGIETAAYISGNFEISPSLSLETGLRGVWYGLLGPSKTIEYDNDLPRIPESIIDTTFFDRNFQLAWSDYGLEPRIGLRFMLNEDSSLKLSFNRNNQFISLMSNSSVMAPTDVWRLSNKYTKAMQSNQIAMGYFQLFPEHNLEVSIECYYKILNNVVEFRDGAKILMNSLIETDIVRTKGNSYGAEFYLTKKSGILTGWLSYTWSRAFLKSNEYFEIFKINDNNYFPSNFDRPHNLIINSTYRFTRRWRANFTFTYNTGRPVTYPEQVYEYQGHQAIYYSERNKYRLPDYHRLDLAISYDENLKLKSRGKGSWTFSLINVYGRRNAYSVFYRKQQPTQENNHQRYSLYKLFIIGRPLPTITYNFSF